MVAARGLMGMCFERGGNGLSESIAVALETGSYA